MGAAAAEDAPVKGGTLIWGHSETTQNLDIHQTGTASTIRVLQNVHDAIVTVDKNFTVIPSLAQSFEQSPDRFDLHVPPPPGREVPRRQADDLGGRQIFVRPLPRQGDRRGQFRSVQRCRRDRDAGRSHGRHQDESRQRAFPQPARRKRRGRDHPAGLGRPAGQDADRRRAVQVRAARIRPRGRACALRRLLGRAGLSRQGHRARGDRADGAPHGSAHRRNAHDQRHPGRPDEGGQGRSEAPGRHLVPAQLGLRQHESRFRAVQGSAGAAGDRSPHRQGGAVAGRPVGRGQDDRLAELPDFSLVQRHAQEPPPGHREGEGNCSPRRATGRASSTSCSRRRRTTPTMSSRRRSCSSGSRKPGST